MNVERHRRAKELFLAACDVAPAARAAFVAQQCGDDLDLQAAVERLLAHDTSQGVTAADGVRERVAALFDTGGLEPVAVPEHIGRYTVCAVLGQGGFGTVYEAEQHEPVQRRVAVKVVKPGMDSQAVLRRFAAERQLLARMQHPGIATVFDAGLTDDGRPFFVMELVQGVPIGLHCDRQRLDVPARLRLFLRVCAAVQHAHQKGIVHRDLKPSNVLVTIVDGEGVPKVIDFGIGKALDADGDGGSGATLASGQFLGTPEYVSPEQAAGEPDVDTRSDIYALGVLLYELLCGTTPFDRSTVTGGGLPALLAALLAHDAVTPSTRLSRLGDDEAAIAAARCIDAPALRRALQGDLDWIVMKAIEKDRARRYATVAALADDVLRHLQDEPVTARAPTAGYRFRKFARRHRGALIAATAMGVLLVAGIVGTSLGLVQAIAAKDAEAAQRRRAEAINAVFQTALEAGDPFEGGRIDMRVSEAMARVVETLDAGAIADQPTIDAELRLRVAKVLLGNDRLAEAVTLAERAWQQFAAAGPANDADAARAEEQLAIALTRLGRAAAAEPHFQSVLATRQRLHAGDSLEVAFAHRALGVALQTMGRLDDAEASYTSALAMQRRLGGEPRAIAGTLNNVASLRQAQGRLADAEGCLREALALLRAQEPAGHPRTATALANLASVLVAQRRAAEAEPLAREAVAMFQRFLQDSHADVAIGLTSLAFARQGQGDLVEAEAYLRQALAVRERFAVGDHQEVVRSQSNLADVLLATGRPEAAVPLLQQALASNTRLFPAGHPTSVKLGANLAVALVKTGDVDGVAAAVAAAVALAERVLGADHPLRVQSERIQAQIAARKSGGR